MDPQTSEEKSLQHTCERAEDLDNATVINIHRIQQLPNDIAELAELARAEGYRLIDRLIDEFQSAQNTFSLPGEALFEARSARALVGIGGLNVDPYCAGGTTGRIRRMYVRNDHRGRGVGRLLIHAIESRARARFDELRLFTDKPAAAAFYLALGYDVVEDSGATHVKRLNVASSYGRGQSNEYSIERLP